EMLRIAVDGCGTTAAKKRAPSSRGTPTDLANPSEYLRMTNKCSVRVLLLRRLDANGLGRLIRPQHHQHDRVLGLVLAIGFVVLFETRQVRDRGAVELGDDVARRQLG